MPFEVYKFSSTHIMFVQIVDDTYVRLLSRVGSGIVWAVANSGVYGMIFMLPDYMSVSPQAQILSGKSLMMSTGPDRFGTSLKY